MKIENFIHINNTDINEFNKALGERLNELQNEGLEVEIQYKNNVFNNGQVLYSVLLIGRK